MLDPPGMARSKAITATQDLEQLAYIVESSLDVNVSTDLSGTITGWNHGAEAIFGFPTQEIIGQSILRWIPQERHDEEDYMLTRFGRGESVRHFETVQLCKDGSTVDVSISARPRPGTVRGRSSESRRSFAE